MRFMGTQRARQERIEVGVLLRLCLAMSLLLQRAVVIVHWVYVAKFRYCSCRGGLCEKRPEAAPMSDRTSSQLAPRWTHCWPKLSPTVMLVVPL